MTTEEAVLLRAELERERKRRESAEAQAVETRRTLEALFLAAPLAILRIDLDGTVRMWNPAAERMFGWTGEEAVGGFLPFVPDDKRAEADTILGRAFRGEAFVGVEVVRRRKDGADVDVSVSTAPLRDDDGTITGIVSVLEDVTRRKRAEAALREREENYRSLVEASHDMIAVHVDGVFVYVNPAGVRLLGAATADGLAGKPILDFVHPDYRAAVTGRIRAIRDGETAPVMEEKFLRLDGEEVDVEVVGIPLRYEGRPATLVIVRDIRSRKRAEEERRHLEEQLRQSQRLEAVGRLAGGVAHDFNNLLTAVTGYADLLLARLPDDSPARPQVEEIRKAGERAASLTRQLLAYSRRQFLQPEILDLNAVVDGMVPMLRRLIGEDIRLDVSLADGLRRVRADRGQLEQVVANLAVNARDAMPGGGDLVLRTRNVVLEGAEAARFGEAAHGPYVELAVADSGHGMDEATVSRIFEPFYTTKEKGKGTGLGLATVYGIVAQSGGHIAVESAPGRGTVFRIVLPREEGGRDGEQAGARPPVKAPSGAETILLVEDEEPVRALVHEVLASKGYRVVAASNGEEALRLAGSHDGPVHLLLTDVVMPGMNGKELVARLCRVRPGTKILYMSGYTDEEILRRGVREPGVAFLPKPFTPDDLARKVREVIDAPA